MRRNDLTTSQRNIIIQFLLQDSKDGKAAYGKIEEAITKFNSSRRTTSRLKSQAMKQQRNNECINLTSKKPGMPRRKKIHLDLSVVQSLQLSKRGSIRGLASGIQCSKTSVGRWISQGLIKTHTSAIKPDLTASHMLQRVRYSLDDVVYDRCLNVHKFKSMHDTVHIDEKWFQITRNSHRYYLSPLEAEPHRTCKSKKYIMKVMFLCAVGRPLFNADGSVLFDGKIGIWPFTEMVPAKRTSKNRGAGTLEEKPIRSINREVMSAFLINKVVPAIITKWLAATSKTIYIQQDNAKPHLLDSDPHFRAAATSNGFDIMLLQQPPNSPDTNINDLGWFRAIQSYQQEAICCNAADLVKAVVLSFDRLDAPKLNKVFLTLQSCMTEILKCKGQNCYKIPHMKKDHLIRLDMLPFTLEVPVQLVQESFDYLHEKGEVEGMVNLMQQLGLNTSPGA